MQHYPASEAALSAAGETRSVCWLRGVRGMAMVRRSRIDGGMRSRAGWRTPLSAASTHRRPVERICRDEEGRARSDPMDSRSRPEGASRRVMG